MTTTTAPDWWIALVTLACLAVIALCVKGDRP